MSAIAARKRGRWQALRPSPARELPPRWWLTPLVIYVLTRAVDAAMALLAAPGRLVPIERVAGYHSTVPAHLPPSYLEVMTSWDAQWYWGIARDGYAASALGATGHPVQTNLAFFPFFPTVVGTLMRATGGSFPVVATTLNLVVGALAVVVVFGFVAQAVDARRARVCVLLLCCFASAPILQAAYTESLALLFLASALWLLFRRQYLWCAIPILLLGLTRNVVPAVFVVVVAHWVVRIREARAAEGQAVQDVPHGRLAVVALACVAAVGLWPALAALHTGDLHAYMTTVAAWPGFTGSVLMPPWVATMIRYPALAVVLFIVAVVVGSAWLLPGQRRWGVELVGWATAYPLYLLATTPPNFSLIRYLLLAFPLGLVWAPDAPSARSLRAQRIVVTLLAILGLVSQWFWVDKLLVYAGPHGGWGYP